jgi:hypothetical protein
MRGLRYASYVAAIACFFTLHGLNVARSARHARLGAYSRSLVEFLGMRNEREHYLFVKQGGRTIGYTGLKIQRLLEAGDARYGVRLEALARLIPWLGSQGEVQLDADFALDDRGRMTTLTAQVQAGGETFALEGRPDGANLLLQARHAGGGADLTIRLPAEIGLGSALLPVPPLGELRVGERRTIPYFDPLTRRQESCDLHVRGQETVTFAGVRLEAYVVDVTTPAGQFRITATSDGEMLSVAGPGGIEFRRAESHEIRGYLRGRE